MNTADAEVTSSVIKLSKGQMLLYTDSNLEMFLTMDNYQNGALILTPSWRSILSRNWLNDKLVSNPEAITLKISCKNNTTIVTL